MKNNINHIGRITALLCFVIGTTMLSFYIYFGETAVNIGFALGFIILAAIVNIILLIISIGVFVFNANTRIETFKTICILLANIPIAVLYFFMVITFPGHQLI